MFLFYDGEDTVLYFDQQFCNIDYYSQYKSETLSLVKLRFLIQDLTIRNQNLFDSRCDTLSHLCKTTLT